MTNDTPRTDLESPFLDEELRDVAPAAEADRPSREQALAAEFRDERDDEEAPEDEGADFEGEGPAADERDVIVAEDCEGDLDRDDEEAPEDEGADFEGEDDAA